MGLHVFPIPIPPPTSLSTRLILLLKDVRKIDLNETLSYGRDYGTLEADKWFSTSGGQSGSPKNIQPHQKMLLVIRTGKRAASG